MNREDRQIEEEKNVPRKLRLSPGTANLIIRFKNY